MTTPLKFLDEAEFTRVDDERRALAARRWADPEWVRANNATYGWASIADVAGTGACWLVPWFYDPKDPTDLPRREKYLEMISRGEKMNFLSKHYWQDWADKRAPICVVCPGGSEWVVDQVSSNGDGWVVTGDLPKITCSPSIVVPHYHGFLRDGVFTDPI